MVGLAQDDFDRLAAHKPAVEGTRFEDDLSRGRIYYPVLTDRANSSSNRAFVSKWIDLTYEEEEVSGKIIIFCLVKLTFDPLRPGQEKAGDFNHTRSVI